jgi:predicted acetylornithine/succinylornithine family transaminase
LGNVKRQPLAFVRGEGLKLWDADGRQYYDFVSGVAVCAFGHAPAFAAEVLAEQARTLWHVSNLYWNEPMVRLAELLTRASGLDRAYFCNSGAEANETAIKMVRKRSHDLHGPGRSDIVCAQKSFHGRTMGAISATGQAKLQEGFAPLLPGFRHVPFGDLQALREAVDETVCAVLLEPVQGEGGIVVPPDDYLPGAAALCRERGVSLVLDEIQTGLGRTGADFAFRRHGIVPHVLTLGKALGCGYPVGACLADEATASALGPGSHSTTLGGAPLAMALSLELTRRLLEPAFLARVEACGRHFVQRLQELQARRPDVVEAVRGLGLMLGLALKIPAAPVTEALAELGFLVNATAGSVLRFVPPLTTTQEDVDRLAEALAAALERVKPKGA